MAKGEGGKRGQGAGELQAIIELCSEDDHTGRLARDNPAEQTIINHLQNRHFTTVLSSSKLGVQSTLQTA